MTLEQTGFHWFPFEPSQGQTLQQNCPPDRSLTERLELLLLLPVINMFDRWWKESFLRGRRPSEKTLPSHVLCVFLVFPLGPPSCL